MVSLCSCQHVIIIRSLLYIHSANITWKDFLRHWTERISIYTTVIRYFTGNCTSISNGERSSSRCLSGWIITELSQKQYLLLQSPHCPASNLFRVHLLGYCEVVCPVTFEIGSGNSCNHGLLDCWPFPIPTFSYITSSIPVLFIFTQCISSGIEIGGTLYNFCYCSGCFKDSILEYFVPTAGSFRENTGIPICCHVIMEVAWISCPKQKTFLCLAGWKQWRNGRLTDGVNSVAGFSIAQDSSAWWSGTYILANCRCLIRTISKWYCQFHFLHGIRECSTRR